MMRRRRRDRLDDREEIVERVAAIDVAKASGKVVHPGAAPDAARRRVTKVWDVAATTRVDHGRSPTSSPERIERVVVESTSDYWRPFFYLLEARGLIVWLVNARDVKQVPGRPKTDKLDAVWLAKLNERGMLRPSFVPPAEIRQLPRLHAAARRPRRGAHPAQAARREAARGRPDQALDGRHRHLRRSRAGRCSTRSSPESATRGPGRAGPRQAAAPSSRRSSRRSTGRFDDHHAELSRCCSTRSTPSTPRSTSLTARIDELIAEDARLPGAPTPATPSAGRPASRRRRAPRRDHRHRADRCPDDHRRGRPRHGPVPDRRPPRVVGEALPAHGPVRAKSRGGQDRQGQPLPEAASSAEAATAAPKTDTFLGERYRRLVKRSGKLKALVAVDRSILVIVWHLLADPTAASTTSAPTSTTDASTSSAAPATSSASSRRSATGSPSARPPEHPTPSGLRPERGSAPHPGLGAPTLVQYFN